MGPHLFINPHPIFLVPQVYSPILISRPDCVYVHISLPEMQSLHFFTWQISTCLSGPLNVIFTEQPSLTPLIRLCAPMIYSHSTIYFSTVTLPIVNCAICLFNIWPPHQTGRSSRAETMTVLLNPVNSPAKQQILNKYLLI